MEKNRRIIVALQTEVEDRLAQRPGVYDGNKSLFTSFDLGFETGAREVSFSDYYQIPDSTRSALFLVCSTTSRQSFAGRGPSSTSRIHGSPHTRGFN